MVGLNFKPWVITHAHRPQRANAFAPKHHRQAITDKDVHFSVLGDRIWSVDKGLRQFAGSLE
jgi:hypothetical protein